MRFGERLRGGLHYGHVVVGVSFLIMAVSDGSIYSFGVFFEPLVEQFGWTRALISGSFAAFSGLYGVFSVASGMLTDRLGPRIVVTISGLVLCSGFLLMSQATSVSHLYVAYGLLIAAGFSGMPVPLQSTAARWFKAQRGLMTGIVMAGTGAGTMLMPLLANWLLRGSDWRMAYMVLGLVLAAVVVPSAQLLRRNSGKDVRSRVNPREALTERAATQPEQPGLDLKGAARTGRLWLLCLAFMSFGYVMHAVMVHIVIHARGLGATPAEAAGAMTVIGFFGMTGRIGVGSSADRLGVRRPLVSMLATLSAALFWLTFAAQPWTVMAIAAVFGFVYGGTLPLLSNTVAEFFGLRAHGGILGMLVCFIGIGSAMGPVVTGYLFDLLGSYFVPFAVCGATAALSAALAAVSTAPNRGKA